MSAATDESSREAATLSAGLCGTEDDTFFADCPAQGPVDVVVGQHDTYPMPEHGWTCFHCGETFTTPGAAREHFGPTPNVEPGCTIKVQLGGERGLLNALRKAEARLARYMEEDTDLHRAMYAMQSRHTDALMAAEEAGYARGVRDGMNMTPDERAKVLPNVQDNSAAPLLAQSGAKRESSSPG